MKKPNKILMTLVLTNLLMISLITSVSSSQLSSTSTKMNYDSPNHEPIVINGNDDFTPGNGVTGGSGTENDPYMISDWIIQGDGKTDYGIFINNTDVFFIVRNCTVSKFHNTYTGGIFLVNVVNGRISNSTAYNNEAGIRIEESSLIQIDNTTCHNNIVNWYSDGIVCFDSQEITIVDCNISNNKNGIHLINTSTSRICHSSVYSNGVTGITLFGINSKYIVVEHCDIYNNVDFGIDINCFNQRHISTFNRISNCYIAHNGISQSGELPRQGIFIWFASDNIIENCTIDGNGEGIGISASINNIIRNCTIKKHKDTTGWINYGLHIEGYFIPWQTTKNNQVNHCDIVDNEGGAILTRCFNTIFQKNNYINNSFEGIFVSMFATCKFLYNNIVHNGYDNNDTVTLFCWRFTYSDVRHNWWGTEDGPKIIAFNDQSKIYKFLSIVLYLPWLTDPVPDAGRQT